MGRVYVNDPDDWDLPDKKFQFKNPSAYPDFALDRNTGMITMKEGIDLVKEVQSWLLEFLVEDSVHGQTGRSAVTATVNVTVQKIPKEAVLKSGSVRLAGPPEEFIKPDVNGVSKRDQFKKLMSIYLNATYVDVFTVLGAKDNQFTDVRFSAHGSPYYKPERLEGEFKSKY